ncbi:MAG: c-type cytochrome [Verrucomicrobia bacterium]|nr:c-type cytochrome [Verrucomicrobiota bacterium]
MSATLVAATAASAPARQRTAALPPAEALKTFQLEAGLRLDLVAAEPLVASPVAIAFDEQGRLFVVEGRGYPEPVDGKNLTTEGRVALLTDTDGDGHYDKRTEFATGLGYPNGIVCWRGGVFVTCAPDIFYLKDTDGDGIADVKRVVLTGFDTSRSSQLRVSSPTLGLDGKIYVASGLTGGKVTSPEHPERAAVNFAPADGRFDPDTLAYEVTGGRGQFGLAFDAFGRRFVSSNRHPVLQIVLEPWQLKRNPHLAFALQTQEVSKVEAEAKVWPISGAAVTADFIPNLMNAPHTGTFTSACGVMVFGGTALPAAFQGNVFICEPAQNLVQRQVLRPEGATLRSDLATPGREFLASADTWFRPVFATNGPDGALYLVDMHRREIDHPAYVPAESRGLFDFVSGKNCGRIYRIAAAPPRRAVAMVNEATALVRELGSAETWRAGTAFRLLLERREGTARAELAEVATGADQAAARVQARALLAAGAALDEAAMLVALRDRHAGAREHAVGLAAAALAKSPALLKAISDLASDEDARVRFACALALSGSAGPRVIETLALIGARDGADRWTRAAVLSGVGGRLEGFYAALRSQRGTDARGVRFLLQDLGRLFGTAATFEAGAAFLRDMMEPGADIAERVNAVLGLAEGWQGRPAAGKTDDAEFGRAFRSGDEGLRAAVRQFLGRAERLARDPAKAPADRAAALTLLGIFGPGRAAGLFREMLAPRQPIEVQLAVVRACERAGDQASGALLLEAEKWSRYSPQMRAAVLAAVTAKLPMLLALFEAIERGTLAPTEIPPAKRTQLQKHANAGVKTRAEAAFKRIEAGDRMAVYRNLREVISTPADAAKGRDVFTRICATCHTRGGVGGKVGPDLTGIRNQPAEAILLHTVVPNYEVAPAYQEVTDETRDARTLTGWVVAETDSAVTLRTAAGPEEIVLRTAIVSLSAAGVSLMPDGLEQAMTKEELASLIAFLKSEQ